MKLIFNLFFGFNLFIMTISPQKINFPLMSDSAQAVLLTELKEKINSNLLLELSDSTEFYWLDAFWAAQFILDKSDFVVNSIRKALIYSKSCSNNEFIRGTLQAAYTLSPVSFETEIGDLLTLPLNSKNFAIAINYLSRIKGFTKYSALAEDKAKEFQDDAILIALLNNIKNSKQDLSVNEIIDLLLLDPGDVQVLIYSFQRFNRNYPGITLIKYGKTGFVYNEQDELFYINQLARSITNLPGYLTNGNTPQGLFFVEDTYMSDNRFIGPSERIRLFLPYESGSKKFLNNLPEYNNDFDKFYTEFLPNSLKDNVFLYESLLAGKAGRDFIVIHGNTVNPGYYRSELYYPNIPTLGCVSSFESWDMDGNLSYSDQQKLLNEYKKLGKPTGYFLLVEINGKEEPVSIEEIQPLIQSLNIK
ncbi:MAG: hypothetical protein IAE91_11690 [Ignavibacteriaceae bacterium]|nr:hypothetical protein [Ignavibacteriaceae bacterium]